MTTEFSGGGDPQRTIELLWGPVEPRKRRGPKPKLTVQQIATKAIGMADREGLEAVSMRKLADELDVTAMSMYTYVPSKAELIDLMLDRVFGEVTEPPPGKRPRTWRAKLELVARQNWDLYQRHPWLLQVAVSRPVPGPNLIAKYDYELRAVDGIGLTDIQMDRVVSLVGNYVHGAVRGAIAAREVVRRTGKSDAEWWDSYAPLLEKVIDGSKWPTAGRVGTATGEEYQAADDPTGGFEFGLQRLLDGIEELLDKAV